MTMKTASGISTSLSPEICQTAMQPLLGRGSTQLAIGRCICKACWASIVTVLTLAIGTVLRSWYRAGQTIDPFSTATAFLRCLSPTSRANAARQKEYFTFRTLESTAKFFRKAKTDWGTQMDREAVGMQLSRHSRISTTTALQFALAATLRTSIPALPRLRTRNRC